MMTNNLTVGMIVKNYKDLCRVLGVEVKKTGSNSHKAQLKEFDRYFSYDKQGHKITITEIYDVIQDKIDNRVNNGGNNSIYTDLSQEIILQWLLKNGGYINQTAKHFISELCIANINYEFCKDKIPSFRKYMNMHSDYIIEFYDKARGSFRSVIETSLSALVKKEIIKYEKVKMVCTVKNEYIEATKQEIEQIKVIEKELLEEMGYKSVNVLKYIGKQEQYNILLGHRLMNALSIRYSYTTYEVRLLDKSIISKDVKEEKKELNKIVCENIIEKAKERHIKTKEKYSNMWGTPKFENSWDTKKYFSPYYKNYEKLVEILIKQDADSIESAINAIKQKTRDKEKARNKSNKSGK